MRARNDTSVSEEEIRRAGSGALAFAFCLCVSLALACFESQQRV